MGNAALKRERGRERGRRGEGREGDRPFFCVYSFMLIGKQIETIPNSVFSSRQYIHLYVRGGHPPSLASSRPLQPISYLPLPLSLSATNQATSLCRSLSLPPLGHPHAPTPTSTQTAPLAPSSAVVPAGSLGAAPRGRRPRSRKTRSVHLSFVPIPASTSHSVGRSVCHLDEDEEPFFLEKFTKLWEPRT